MNQRLYFLLPDREHALNVINELRERGITKWRNSADDRYAAGSCQRSGAQCAKTPPRGSRRRIKLEYACAWNL